MSPIHLRGNKASIFYPCPTESPHPSQSEIIVISDWRFEVDRQLTELTAVVERLQADVADLRKKLSDGCER